jgi:DNA-directed RNA polymerase subunit RPC12/RpoP
MKTSQNFWCAKCGTVGAKYDDDGRRTITCPTCGESLVIHVVAVPDEGEGCANCGGNGTVLDGMYEGFKIFVPCPVCRGSGRPPVDDVMDHAERVAEEVPVNIDDIMEQSKRAADDMKWAD